MLYFFKKKHFIWSKRSSNDREVMISVNEKKSCVAPHYMKEWNFSGKNSELRNHLY